MVIDVLKRVPVKILLRPHHAHVDGIVRDFYLHADPSKTDLSEAYLEEFSSELVINEAYAPWGGSSDVLGDTPAEFRGYVRRLSRFNKRIRHYPDSLPVEIMVTTRDPLCHLAVKKRHCNDYREDEGASIGEEIVAEEIFNHINYCTSNGARLRRTRRPNRVVVETTWGALTTYWRRWDEVPEDK